MTEPFIPARPPGPHPTPEELFAAHQRPEAPESEPVLAHAAVCARCSEELLQLEAFTVPEPLPAARIEAAWKRFGPPPAPARRSRAFSRPFLALAAGLAACALGLGIWSTQKPSSLSAPPPPVDVVRGGPETGGVWLPTGPLAEAPTEIVFPAGPEPQRVLVFDGASYRWTSEPTTEGRIVFPEEERKKLKPGVEYFWTLTTGQETAARSFVVTGK